MNIPILLKNQRNTLKFTQQQIADKLHVSRNTYTQYETGTRKIDTETFFQLVDILDINITVKEFLNSEVRMRELNKKKKEWDQKREELFEVIAQDDIEKVTWFMENGMDKEIKNKENIRAFVYALQHNAYNVVEYLLKKNAVYYLEEENQGLTPLCYVSEKGYIETARILLQCGIHPDEHNNEGVPSLWLVAGVKNREVFSLMMHHGAEINAKIKDHNGSEINIFIWLMIAYAKIAIFEGRRPFEKFDKEDNMMLFIKENYQEQLDQDNLNTIQSYIQDFF